LSQDQNAELSVTVPASEAYAKSEAAKKRFILEQLVGKDFKRKYRRSVLGVVWSVLNPLLMMVVMSLVFSFFLRYDNIEHYPLYLILGNVIWQVFADSTNQGVTSILDAAPLLKKVRIKKTVFPAERVLFSLVNFAFSLVAVLLVMLYEGVTPSWTMLMLPILLVLLLGFCLGMSLILSSLAVYFRDVIHLWSVVLTAWNYMTPIFWPSTMIGSVPYGFMRVIMLANPMYNYVTFMRMTWLNGMVPEPITIAMCVFWAVVALAGGYLVFNKLQRKFILYI
jgi:ABC-2 type transport system permease protein